MFFIIFSCLQSPSIINSNEFKIIATQIQVKEFHLMGSVKFINLNSDIKIITQNELNCQLNL